MQVTTLNTEWASKFPVNGEKYCNDYDSKGQYAGERSGQFRSAWCPTFRYYPDIDKSVLSVYLSEIKSRPAHNKEYAAEDHLNFIIDGD